MGKSAREIEPSQSSAKSAIQSLGEEVRLVHETKQDATSAGHVKVRELATEPYVRSVEKVVASERA